MYKFLWARFLRIYPGFWVCLIVTALIFAPIAGLVRGGWRPWDAVSYITANSTLRMGQWSIGDTLAGAAYSKWDGSLWTLKYEFGCYVFIGLFLSVTCLRRGWWMAGAFVFFTSATVLRNLGLLGLQHSELYNWALFVPFFVAGALIHRYRQSVPMSLPLFLISALAIAAASYAGWGTVVAPLPLAYCVMWLGVELPRMIERFRDGTVDISYGMYIYGMPVQQLLFLFGVQHFGVVAMIFASVVCTVLPAALSWFLLEKPCLRLKSSAWSFGEWAVKLWPRVKSEPESLLRGNTVEGATAESG